MKCQSSNSNTKILTGSSMLDKVLINKCKKVQVKQLPFSTQKIDINDCLNILNKEQMTALLNALK